MEIRELGIEDVKRYKQICSYCYHITATDEDIKKAEEDRKTIKKDVVSIGVFEEKLESIIEIAPYIVRFEGNDIKMGGICGVTTAPEARGKGYIRELFIEAFKRMRENGQIISHLFPFRGDYYRKFDYEVSAETVTWHIPTEYINNFSKTGELKSYDGSDNMKNDIKEVYKEFVKNKNLARTDKKFDNLKPYEATRFTYIHYTNNKADGVITYHTKSYENKPQDIILDNFWYSDINGMDGNLWYLSTLRDYSDKCIIPCNDDLSEFIEFNGGWGKKDTIREVRYSGSTRVIDVYEVLKLKKIDDEVSIKIIDKFCPWNNDVFTISNGEVKRGADDFDAVLTIRAFSALVMGRYKNLDYVKEVEIIKNKDKLEKLFEKRDIWFDEHF